MPTVHFLGQREYSAVADYMAACDVLIMPWNSSEWIKACNPVKLKEYLAVGRPVVTTWFDELRRYEGFVRVANDADSFARAISNAINAPGEPNALRKRVQCETWRAKAGEVLKALADVGVGLDSVPNPVGCRPFQGDLVAGEPRSASRDNALHTSGTERAVGLEAIR